MKTLTINIGAGTRDVLLYDSRCDVENGFTLALLCPTMMVRRRIKEATAAGNPMALLGRQMGGGPPAWTSRRGT